MPQLRRMNRLHERYAGKGLHMIGAFTQFQPLAEIEKHITEMGIRFPVAMDGFWDTELRAQLLCHIFVIGVDGTLVHVSVNGWEEAALKELEKVKYPGLGLAEVHEPLEPAAKAFGAGKFSEAYRLATAVSESDHELKVLEQADRMLERVRARMATLEGRARLAELLGDYDVALACLAELESRYAGVDEYADFAGRLAALREREDLEDERKARREFMALRLDVFRGVSAAGSDAARIKAIRDGIARLKKFQESNAERAVVSMASDMQASYEAWARELEDEAEGKE
jgi:hypothetical protein